MKVILTKNIASLGKKGDIKEVSGGYARNFLFPRKIAEIATEKAVAKIEQEKKKELKNQKEVEAQLEILSHSLRGKKIMIKSKAEEGKLYGSVGAKEIAFQLARENINIPEKSILIKEPIRKIGEYAVGIELGKSIKFEVNVSIKEE